MFNLRLGCTQRHNINHIYLRKPVSNLWKVSSYSTYNSLIPDPVGLTSLPGTTPRRSAKGRPVPDVWSVPPAHGGREERRVSEGNEFL